MKTLAVAALMFVSGCAFLQAEDNAISVRVDNETGLAFTTVILDLGASDESRAAFEDVAPGALTRFQEVQDAFLQPFIVRAQTEGRELTFDLVAAFAIPLDPGRYTYTLRMDEENRLHVERK